ncbi:hypothetical protein SLA2020_454350 [Shorea laevis]
MESANLHHQHHQLQDQLLASSSSLPTTTCYGSAGTNHSWNPNITLNNTGNFHPNSHGVLFSNTGDSRQNSEILVPSLNSSMLQESGFHWSTSQSAHELHLSKIKEEFSESFPKFTEMLNSSTSSSSIEDYHFPPATTSHIKNEQKNLNIDLGGDKLLLKTISSKGFYSNAPHNCASFGSDEAVVASRGNFSHIYPSINISNLNQPPSAFLSSLDMNLQAFDLLTSERYSGSFSQPSHDTTFGPSFGLDHHMQQLHRPSCSPSNFTNRVTEAKRPSLMEAKASQAAPKKSRLEPRASCPPFKVRKEKLGDRIAALQQLVAPFGKTDTASVLMEAIGYIKFLQNQVETLSVPYMKSSRNKPCRTMQAVSMDDENEEARRDLRSRGLYGGGT